MTNAPQVNERLGRFCFNLVQVRRVYCLLRFSAILSTMDALNARASAKRPRSPVEANQFLETAGHSVRLRSALLAESFEAGILAHIDLVLSSASRTASRLRISPVLGWTPFRHISPRNPDLWLERHRRRGERPSQSAQRNVPVRSARTDAQLDALPWLIPAVHLPFLVLFCSREGPRMFAWYFALLAATALYNWPRAGLKNFPVADMLNQLGYLLVFYLSSALNHVPQLPWASFLFGGLFAMHSHLLGQIFDVVPDRLSNRRTTAVVIGLVPAKMLLSGFLVVETLIVLAAFHSLPIGLFLACGATWFWLDAFWIYRNRPLPGTVDSSFPD